MTALTAFQDKLLAQLRSMPQGASPAALGKKMKAGAAQVTRSAIALTNRPDRQTVVERKKGTVVNIRLASRDAAPAATVWKRKMQHGAAIELKVQPTPPAVVPMEFTPRFLNASEDVQRAVKFLSGVADTLLEKNAAYGNSAGNPMRVFSNSDRVEQLRVRIDDKLSRIYRGEEAHKTAVPEDTIKDLVGYLALLHSLESNKGG
jgi:hypothetical protein